MHGGSGFALSAEKNAGKSLSGRLGFASVDKDYSCYNNSRFFHAVGFGLNGDAYGLGKRVFMGASFKVNRVVSASGFYTHSVGEKVLNLDQQNLYAGLNFDFKALANAGKRIF